MSAWTNRRRVTSSNAYPAQCCVLPKMCLWRYFIKICNKTWSWLHRVVHRSTVRNSQNGECLTNIVPINPLTLDEKRGFNNATDCHICEEPFVLTDVKHRDHYHFTGKYRGAAHEACNLNYTKFHSIPIVFHNLSGYDSHFLIKSLATQFDGGINLLPINKERYISFTKYVKDRKVNLRFIDSFRFMASSLASSHRI